MFLLALAITVAFWIGHARRTAELVGPGSFSEQMNATWKLDQDTLVVTVAWQGHASQGYSVSGTCTMRIPAAAWQAKMPPAGPRAVSFPARPCALCPSGVRIWGKTFCWDCRPVESARVVLSEEPAPPPDPRDTPPQTGSTCTG